MESVADGLAEPHVRLAALMCLAERAAGRLPGICQQLADAGQEGRQVEIAMDLGVMRRKWSDFEGSRHGEAAEQAAALLPPLLKEISDAVYELETKAAPVLSDDARKLLARLGSPSEGVRLFRVSLDEHLPMFVPNDVRWLLANTEEESSAIVAIEAAIRHGMTAEIEAGLSHRFAAVVARSLKAVATPLAAPLPGILLALADHTGSYVALL